MLSLIVCLSACSPQHQEIGLLTPTTGTISWDAVHTGAVFGAAKCELKVHYDAPPRADDLRTQLELFRTFVGSHYLAIVVAPIQERAMRDPISRAAAAGQPVIVVDTDLGIRSPNIAYVLNDEESAGRLAANKIGELLRGKGSIIVMGLDQTASAIVTREHALEQELSTRFPDIRVVQRIRGSTNLSEAQQAAESLLSANDDIDAIVALTSFATQGAFYALAARHSSRHIHLVGFNQDDLTVPIRDGEIDAVVAERSADIGGIVAQLACDLRKSKAWRSPYIVKPLLITPGNIDSSTVSKQLNGAWWESANEDN